MGWFTALTSVYFGGKVISENAGFVNKVRDACIRRIEPAEIGGGDFG